MWFLYRSLNVFYVVSQCVVCGDYGLVNYVLSHAFFLEWACFLVPIQVQGSVTSHSGLFILIMRVLSLEITDLTFFMQLYA